MTSSNPKSEIPNPNSPARRWFFQECGVGLGAIALQSLLGGSGSNSAAAAPLPPDPLRGGGASTPPPAAPAFADPMPPKQPHFAPKAKRVIYLFMAGARSH